jgi:adenylate cyclase
MPRVASPSRPWSATTRPRRSSSRRWDWIRTSSKCSNTTRARVTRRAETPAAEYFERASAASPDDIRCPILLAQAYHDLGHRRDAEIALRRGLEKIERELQRHPEHGNAAALGAIALARLGETARAKDWASLALSVEPDDLLTQYNTACAYALIGEPGMAIDLLERSVPRFRGRLSTRVRHDSDLDSLRSRPRFQALLQRMTN